MPKTKKNRAQQIAEKAERERLERKFRTLCRQHGLPDPEASQFLAIPGSKRAYDFAWPSKKLLVEVQGGIWARGKMGHNSGSGILRDQFKLAHAQMNGYVLLQVSESNMDTGEAFEWVRFFLERET